MSNIASLSRTDGRAPSPTAPTTEDLLAFVRTALATVLFALLLISFTPFVLEVDAQQVLHGNILNQVGYSALALAAIVSHCVFTERTVLLALLRPAWLLTLGALCLSVDQALMPELALRSYLFTVMAMIAATAVVCLPPNGESFRTVLTLGALAALGLSYVGIVLFPDAAVHSGGEIEAQHAGLWRGIYSHKNLAGPVMAMLMFAGLYLLRCGRKRTGLLVAVLAAFFVYKTGSKTTLALTPAVAFLVIAGRTLGGRVLPVLLIVGAVIGFALMTLGSAFSPFLDGILQWVLPGTTFTGRIDLWRFTMDLLEPRQWTGYGYDAFWGTDRVFKAEAPFELSWDPRLIVNAHSGYLELALWGGWITMMLAILMVFVLPLYDYVRTPDEIESKHLADFFLMILAFALLNSFLESYLFLRANPIWMLTWIAIVGLRMTSRFRIA